MAWTVDDALRALRENAEEAKTLRIELTDDYLALIARVEAMPENQPGADKTDRWRGARAYKEFFRHVKPRQRSS